MMTQVVFNYNFMDFYYSDLTWRVLRNILLKHKLISIFEPKSGLLQKSI